MRNGDVDGGEKLCVGCQHCMAVCPVGAQSFGGKNPDDSEPVGYCNGEELLRLIKSRRSVRFYKKQDIPTETLTKLTDMLAYPPTGGNRDNLHFSIVGSAAKMRELVKLTYAAIEANDKPSPTMTFCLEQYRNGVDFVYRGAPSLVAVSIDLSKTSRFKSGGTAGVLRDVAENPILSLRTDSNTGTVAMSTTATAMRNFSVMLLGLPSIKYQRTVQREAARFKIILSGVADVSTTAMLSPRTETFGALYSFGEA